LTEYKSIILITDLEQAESLILPLFSTCFDIVSGTAKSSGAVEVSKSVEYHLNNLLAIILDEVTLPQDVTDIIISQFLRVDPGSASDQLSKTKKQSEAKDGKQTTLILKDYPPAYNMAKSLCTSCPEKMTTQICQYFNNVIVDASAAISTSGTSKHAGRRLSDADVSDDDAEGLADLSKAHRLIRELWRACPDVLVNVIPQLEAELLSDNVSLRLLATETLGDVVAGIGIAGLPPLASPDPAAYPLPSIDAAETTAATTNPLTTPLSPKPFSTVHSAAYSSFLSRRHDKSPVIRAAWTTAVSRILLTSAGGIGISESEHEVLLKGLAQMLGDADEKVRLAAIKSISAFDYRGVVNRLGLIGGISEAGSVIAGLAERCKDRKQPVREEAVQLLARLWGVASLDIERGSEKVTAALGEAPTRIFATYFTNDADIHVMIDKVLFESMIPISFPPVKVRISRTDGQKHRAKDREDGSQEGPAVDPDAIRVRRILTLIRSLDSKTRMVFFSMQLRQAQLTKAMGALLNACEQYNGGVVDGDEDEIKSSLARYIDGIAKHFPDPQKVSADLWKFAKMHDRRNYQLIKFAMGPQHDYRTVTKAIKELTKRIQTGPANTQSLLETLTPLLYRCSLLVYNRSHVPAIMDISRTDESGLSETAHEMLKEISARNPEVLKTHIQDLCKDLEANAPTSQAEGAPGADTLKACAAFARKYPSEVLKDRKFLTAMTQYALFSTSPRAAKHAVSIVLTVADKKEMYAKEILQKAVENCTHTSPHFLASLAAIAQLCLLAPATVSAESDAILKIVYDDILPHNRTSNGSHAAWSDSPDDETISKELALKILVNRCRSEDDKANPEEFEEIATPLYALLVQLITNDGEIAKQQDTPLAQKTRLKLTAARFILKLCTYRRRCEDLVTPSMFVSIASIVLSTPNEVRVGFVNQLKKYLGQHKLNYRWFTMLFLIAFDPDEELKSSTITWLKSRVQFYARHQQQAKIQNPEKHANQNVMESLLARLLSLLAHHPDYPEDGTENHDNDLLDFSQYICFFLSAVATEDNLSLILHVSQRVKQTQDAVTGEQEKSERLHVLSDLAQSTIRYWADLMPAHQRGINLLQTWPGKASLPTSLFKALPSHKAAQEIAEKNFLPEDVATRLERLVRAYVKASKSGQHGAVKVVPGERKRKSSVGIDEEGDEEKPAKKVKRATTLPVRKAIGGSGSVKTPKSKRKSSDLPSSEMPSRKSSRMANTTAISYQERDSSEDEAEMLEIDRLASSPTVKKRVDKAERPKPEWRKAEEQQGLDSEMEEQADGNEHKNDSALSAGDDEEEKEKEPSPSPLKEKSNGNIEKTPVNRGGKKIVPAAKKAASAKTTAPPRASARETRSRKA
jgi:sister chromatid cohesion protein PDS5